GPHDRHGLPRRPGPRRSSTHRAARGGSIRRDSPANPGGGMGRTALRRLTGPALGLLLAAGCRMPPGQVTACRPTLAPRPVLLAAQGIDDTAVMAAAHPVRSGYGLATEPL